MRIYIYTNMRNKTSQSEKVENQKKNGRIRTEAAGCCGQFSVTGPRNRELFSFGCENFVTLSK